MTTTLPRRRGGAHLQPDESGQPQTELAPSGKLAPYEAILHLVLDGVDSPHTKIAYRRALTDFLAWHGAHGYPPLTKATIQGYRNELVQAGYSASSVNQRLAAIRKLVREAVDNQLLDPTQLAGIERVAGLKQQGRRSGNWLDRAQAQGLLNAPDTTTLKGLRDRALLAVLLGCGLRRSEVVALTFADVQPRERRWVIVDLVGKHQRVRSIPMPTWCKQAIDAWQTGAGLPTEGYIFRPLNKGEKVAGPQIAAQTVLDVVRHYGQLLGHERLAPHDLRRTFARLARKGGSELDQIKESLGHASVQTTERYVGAVQSLTDAPADRLGLE